jgi:hypothetical protein
MDPFYNFVMDPICNIFVMLHADDQQDWNVQWFQFDVINGLTHWYIQWSHSSYKGRNITCYAMVYKPWIHNFKMFKSSSIEHKCISITNVENCEIQQILVIWKLLLWCVFV